MKGIFLNICQENGVDCGLSTYLMTEKDVSEGGRVCIGDIQLTVEKVSRDGDEEMLVKLEKSACTLFLARERWHIREKANPEVTTGRFVRALLH